MNFAKYLLRTFLLLLIPIQNLQALPPKNPRLYVQQMYDSFLLQSIGQTRLSYLVFKKAYQEAQIAGENPQKLALMDALFRCYRKYGWSSGFMTEPSRCSDECRDCYFDMDDMERDEECDEYERLIHSYSIFQSKIYYANHSDSYMKYKNEWEKDPKRAKNTRDYFTGLAIAMTGYFMYAGLTTPPGIALLAGAIASDGISRMINAFLEAYSDRADLNETLNKIEKMSKEAGNN